MYLCDQVIHCQRDNGRGILQVMKLLVGLGNIGESYDRTRHNVGFWAIDAFAHSIEVHQPLTWKTEKKFFSQIAETTWQITGTNTVEKIYLIKPTTFMNDSGKAVAAVANFYNIPTSDIWVIHDDVDFPVGVLKIREGGSSAGHNGILSIIESLGSDKFWRFRIGVGRPLGKEEKYNVIKHVLRVFSAPDHRKMQEVIKHTIAAIELALDKDLSAAMNRYNISGK